MLNQKTKEMKNKIIIGSLITFGMLSIMLFICLAFDLKKLGQIVLIAWSLIWIVPFIIDQFPVKIKR
ncbi:MAG: hypothetical protein WCX48_09740 [Bacteroidales bacterium]